ncbi:MAG: hypothetical protein OJF50_005396 [Nitrospira sp.]|nr:hypothetical protein [Nitrospira sp.]
MERKRFSVEQIVTVLKQARSEFLSLTSSAISELPSRYSIVETALCGTGIGAGAGVQTAPG